MTRAGLLKPKRAALVALAATACLLALAGTARAASFVASTGSTNAAIGSPGSLRVIDDVSTRGSVTDVNVSVRITHNSSRDLVLALRTPSNRYVILANSLPAGPGADYGSGAASCSGTQTTFDDAAAALISAGSSPFNGSFRPEQPLSALNGTPTQGRWELYVFDTAGEFGGTGAVNCATIVVNYKPKKKKKKKKK